MAQEELELMRARVADELEQADAQRQCYSSLLVANSYVKNC